MTNATQRFPVTKEDAVLTNKQLDGTFLRNQSEVTAAVINKLNQIQLDTGENRKSIDDIFEQIESIEGGSPSWDKIQNKPEFSDVAFSGDYNDLINKPIIPDSEPGETPGLGEVSEWFTLDRETETLTTKWNLASTKTVSSLGVGMSDSGDIVIGVQALYELNDVASDGNSVMGAIEGNALVFVDGKWQGGDVKVNLSDIESAINDHESRISANESDIADLKNAEKYFTLRQDDNGDYYLHTIYSLASDETISSLGVGTDDNTGNASFSILQSWDDSSDDNVVMALGSNLGRELYDEILSIKSGNLDGITGRVTEIESELIVVNSTLTDHEKDIAGNAEQIIQINQKIGPMEDAFNRIQTWFQITEDGKTLKTTYNLASDKTVSSLGIGTDNGEVGVSYDRLDSWENYIEGSGAVLGADLGYGLLERIEDLEQGIGENIHEISTKVKEHDDSIISLQNEDKKIGSAISSLQEKIGEIDTIKEWFTLKDNVLHTIYSLASDSTISSLGVGEDEGDTGGTAALYQLVDVLADGDKVSGAADGNVLMFDGTAGKWYGKKVNIPTEAFTEVNEKIAALQNGYNTLDGTVNDFLTEVNVNDTIDRWKELEKFLNGYTETATLASLLGVKADKSVVDALDGNITKNTKDITDILNTLADWFTLEDGVLHSKYGLASDKTVASLGVGSDGTGGISYDRLDSWDSYTDDKAGYVLSALLGWDLKTRLDNLDLGDFDLSGYQPLITSVNKLSASLVSGLATVATSGKYSDLSELPTLLNAHKIDDQYYVSGNIAFGYGDIDITHGNLNLIANHPVVTIGDDTENVIGKLTRYEVAGYVDGDATWKIINSTGEASFAFLTVNTQLNTPRIATDIIGGLSAPYMTVQSDLELGDVWGLYSQDGAGGYTWCIPSNGKAELNGLRIKPNDENSTYGGMISFGDDYVGMPYIAEESDDALTIHAMKGLYISHDVCAVREDDDWSTYWSIIEGYASFKGLSVMDSDDNEVTAFGNSYAWVGTYLNVSGDLSTGGILYIGEGDAKIWWDATNKCLRTNVAFASDSTVSSLGVGSDEGGGGTGGAIDLTNVVSHIIPSLSNAYTIGDANTLWKAVYATEVYAGDVAVGSSITSLQSTLGTATSNIQGLTSSLNSVTSRVGNIETNYLPLGGGTMSGVVTLDHYTNSYSYISFKNNRVGSGGFSDSIISIKDGSDNIVGRFGMYGTTDVSYYYIGHNTYNGDNLRVYTDKVSFGNNTVLHAGNIRDYALPYRNTDSEPTNSGYGLWGNVGAYLSAYYSSSYNLKFRVIGGGALQLKTQAGDVGTDWSTIIHSGNYTDYALSKNGGTISGDLAVSGDTSLTKSLTVIGKTELQAGLDVIGTVQGLEDVAGNTTWKITSDGAASFGSTLKVTGATTLEDKLTISKNGMSVAGAAYFGGGTMYYFGSTGNIYANTLSAAATTLRSTLSVSGNATFDNKVIIGGAEIYWDATNNVLRTNKSFASDGAVSSLGVGSDEDGGVGSVIDLTNVVTNILPADSSLDIGSSSRPWDRVYASYLGVVEGGTHIDGTYVQVNSKLVFANGYDCIDEDGNAYLHNVYVDTEPVALKSDIPSLSGYAQLSSQNTFTAHNTFNKSISVNGLLNANGGLDVYGTLRGFMSGIDSDRWLIDGDTGAASFVTVSINAPHGTRSLFLDSEKDNFIYVDGDDFLAISAIGSTSVIWLNAQETYVSGAIGDDSGGFDNWSITSGGIANFASVSQSSDERLKNILNGDFRLSLATMANAPLVIFDWNNRSNKKHNVGTIAQYWQGVLPEVVSTIPNGTLALAYGELGVAMGISLANILEDTNGRVATVEEEIKTLKEENKRLKERVAELEAA